MTAYECPVCEVIAREPCEDVIEHAALAVLLADTAASPLRAALAEEGVPVCPTVAVPFLVAQPAWPAALLDALAHEACGCPDPMKCGGCLRSLSVQQVDAYFWATREAALAES